MTDIADYRAVNRARAVKTEFYQELIKKREFTLTQMINEYRKADPNKDRLLGYIAELSCLRSLTDGIERNINNLEASLGQL